MVVLCRGVLFSGNANNDANAGFVYANTNNTPSNTNANIGSQRYLSKIYNLASKETLPQKRRNVRRMTWIKPGAKNFIRKTVLVGETRKVLLYKQSEEI